MSKTTVVNIRRSPYDVYIGRGSTWGNPFKIGFGCTRAEAIEQYREYITRRLNKEPGLWAELRELRGKRLGCYCAPQDCHGNVLVELLEKQDV